MEKDEFVEFLESTERKGIKGLVSGLEEIGFFEAPCSGGNHLCEEGGLLQHSLNVCRKALQLANVWGYMDTDAVIIASLLHDVGKCGDYGKKYYTANILKSGKPSASKPFKRNSDLLEKNHAVKSAVIVNRYIKLTEDEEFAILHHDGLYEYANKEAWQEPTELLMIVHFADLWCSRVVERTNDEEE